MASKEEAETVTRTKIGAIPPLGNLFGIPLYVDETLGNNEMVVFNAGEHTKSIRMKYRDFVTVSSPTIGSFTK